MRVAIITDLAPNGTPQGGVQRSTIALIRGLRDLAIDIHALAPDHTASRPYEDRSYDVPVIRVPMRQRYQVLRDFRPWKQACHRVLQDIRPDVIQGQGLLHNGAAAVSWRDCPRVVAAHGDPIADARFHYSAPANIALSPLLRTTVTRIVRQADIVANVTPSWQVNCPVEPRRAAYVPNPVEDLFFDGTKPGPPGSRFMYFGLPRRIKGFDILLDAWRLAAPAIPDARLDVYGATREDAAPYLEDGRDSLAGICFHGNVAKDRVAQEMRAGGIVVVPSRYEVSPVVIAEAWAVGVPVVATRVGGIPAMADGAAELCDVTPGTLAAALSRISRNHEDETLLLEGKARSEAHRASSIAAQTLGLYEGLLSTNG